MNITKIKELMKEKHMSTYRLSKITGIPDSNLCTLFNNKSHHPTIDTVIKIADALEVSLDEIVIRKFHP